MGGATAAAAAPAAPEARCFYCYQALDQSTLALACGHQFHSRCCVQFLLKDKKCPTCLAPVTADGIQEAHTSAAATAQSSSRSPPSTAPAPYPGAPVWTARSASPPCGGSPAAPAVAAFPAGATPVVTYTTPMGPTTEIVAVPTGNAAVPYHYIARERCSWKAAMALGIFMVAIIVIISIPLWII